MGRSSVADAAVVKAQIVSAGLDQASAVGLDGITIGTLATRVGMSKAGIVGPFGSREALQLAILDQAISLFRAAVLEPALAAPAGSQRLRVVAKAWTDYLANGPFAHGCFLTAASCELDAQPGLLRERLVTAVTAWEGFLMKEVRVAVNDGDMSGTYGPADVVLMWVGLVMAANQQIQLLGRRAAAARAYRLMTAIVV